MNKYSTKANLFKIISHPVRLQILDELRKQKSCVCHLQELTGRPQAYISQQLRVLRDASLVIDEKDGQNVFYRLPAGMVTDLLEMVFGTPSQVVLLPACKCPFCSEEQA